MLTVKLFFFRSSAQLTYEEAQNIVDGETDTKFSEAVHYDVRMLFGIANCLHHARHAKEAMSLKRQKLMFDHPNKPTAISMAEARPSIIKIVKEFEFLANKCVAQKISAQYPEQALLRRQAPPDRRKIVSRELEGRFALANLFFVNSKN